MTEEKSLNFIEEIIEADLAKGVHKTIKTRFPPEPNGYLHMGHAKSICLNFGLGEKYGGTTNLRFDDTNPTTEDVEYVDSIKEDIKWLGFSWAEERYASDYFDTLYEYAIKLIKKGLAYVDDSSSEKIASEKGTPTTLGIENEYRSRSVEENLKLFQEMREGKYRDGEKVLRAKIDMASDNMHFRDPVIYRIKHTSHHRTGDKWPIYPMYDFAHGQSDSIENITHSLCTLEFVPHRPLYDWLIEKLEIFPSHQYEFARLNMTYTVMSKRKLLKLVEGGHVTGWDDPRMPTISGIRRKGYTPSSIRTFCEKIGVAKRENMIDISLLEFCIREELNESAARTMAVLDPIKLIIDNFDKSKSEVLMTENYPKNDEDLREITFSNTLWIERDDFMEEPIKKWFRLAPGKMVRLKSAYIIKYESLEKDENGEITAIHATYIEGTKSGEDNSGIKVKGTIHWVDAKNCVPIEARMYDRLFTIEDPAAEENFIDYINPDSLVVKKAFGEKNLRDAEPGTHFQFMRKGYFSKDKDSTPENPVFNLTTTLKDSFRPKSDSK